MEVAHKSERDLRVVALHTHQTLVGVQASDIHPVQELKWVTEVLPTSWVEARGNPTAVHLERVAVAMGVNIGEESQGRAQEAVDNTEAPDVAEA